MVHESKLVESNQESIFDLRLSELVAGDREQEWLDSAEDVPDILWVKVKDLPLDMSLRTVLEKVKKELFLIYGGKKDQGKSFSDSRFTPINEMIERGMVSCGAMSNIFSAVLRKYGIAIKLVHGILSGQDPNGTHRHGWLEVYDPISSSWSEIDPTTRDFRKRNDAIRRKVYHSWSALKPDFERGEY